MKYVVDILLEPSLSGPLSWSISLPWRLTHASYFSSGPQVQVPNSNVHEMSSAVEKKSLINLCFRQSARESLQ